MFDISFVKLLPTHPKVPFMKFRKLAVVFSLIMIVVSIAEIAWKDLNYGIDFTGGTVLELDMGSTPDSEAIRASVLKLDLGNPQVQLIDPPASAGLDYQYVRLTIETQPETDDAGKNAQQVALARVNKAIATDVGPFEIYSQQVVGSKVSGELKQKGILAVILALSMVVIYIWIRFEWQFAIGAVLALVHDVVLTIGVFSLIQLEFNLAIIAAILTIVGYSLNDTVIVYDRIRENLRKYKKMPLPDVLNLSINDTLSRTIMTSLTTLLALAALYVFGGEGLRGFAFAMLWGVLVGTYSSIFVASPLLLMLKLKRGGKMETGAATVAEKMAR